MSKNYRVGKEKSRQHKVKQHKRKAKRSTLPSRCPPGYKASLLHPTMKTAFLLIVAAAKRVIEIRALAMDSEHLNFNKAESPVSLRAQTGF